MFYSWAQKCVLKKGKKGNGEKMFCKIMKVKMPQIQYLNHFEVQNTNWTGLVDEEAGEG